jgi:hypothetical protein
LVWDLEELLNHRAANFFVINLRECACIKKQRYARKSASHVSLGANRVRKFTGDRRERHSDFLQSRLRLNRCFQRGVVFVVNPRPQ